MVGLPHRLDGPGIGWTPEICDGQGGLVCYDSWHHKESDASEQLNWTSLLILTSALYVYLLLMMISASQLDSPLMMTSKVGFIVGILTCKLESHYKTHEINIFCPLCSLLLLNFQERHLSKTLYWRLRWWLAFLPVKYFLNYGLYFLRHNTIAGLIDYIIA